MSGLLEGGISYIAFYIAKKGKKKKKKLTKKLMT